MRILVLNSTFPPDYTGGAEVSLIHTSQGLVGRGVSCRVLSVYNRLAEIGSVWKNSNTTLSEREIQCLSWTAAGKTSAEIAGILGLSEHTVNHYLNHVTKKLDAVNRTQAVVKAMKKGYIS